MGIDKHSFKEAMADDFLGRGPELPSAESVWLSTPPTSSAWDSKLISEVLSGVLVPLMVLGLGIIDSVRRHILVPQTRQILRS